MDFEAGPVWQELYLAIHRDHPVCISLRYSQESERKELLELLPLIKP